MSGVIISFYKKVNRGCLDATFTIQIPAWGGLIIRDCKLFIKEPQTWLGWPSETYVNKAGTTKYKQLVSLTKDAEIKLRHVIEELIKRGEYTTYEQDMERLRQDGLEKTSEPPKEEPPKSFGGHFDDDIPF